MEQVRLEGVDLWNRPVFKSLTSKNRYGSVDILFDYDASTTEILNKVKSEDLIYFGTYFGCEPVGIPANVEIVGF